TWRRANAVVDIDSWRPLTPADRRRVETEAASLPLPGVERDIRVRWGSGPGSRACRLRPGRRYSGGHAETTSRRTMATRQDFTDDEWTRLQKGVTGSAMLVSLSDRAFTDTFGAVGAMRKTPGAQA